MIEPDIVFERDLESLDEFSYGEEKVFWNIKYKNRSFYSLSRFYSNSERVWVFLNGAVGDNPKSLNRWSWGDKIGESFISISDPGISVEDGINLNWYLDNFISLDKPVVRFLDIIMSENSVQPSDLVFYGSSGGGYAALMFASIYPGSSAISINPQENPAAYFSTYVDKWMCSNSWGGNSIGVVDFFKNNSLVPNFILKQNVKDKFHYLNHYSKIVEDFSILDENLLGDVSFVLYSDSKGHSAVPSVSSLELDKESPSVKSKRKSFSVSNDCFFRIVPKITNEYLLYEFKCEFDLDEKALVRFTHGAESIKNGLRVGYSKLAGNFIYLNPEKDLYQFYFDRESQGDLYVSGWFNKKNIKVEL